VGFSVRFRETSALALDIGRSDYGDIYSLLTRVLIRNWIYLGHRGLEDCPFLLSPVEMESRNLAKLTIY